MFLAAHVIPIATSATKEQCHKLLFLHRKPKQVRSKTSCFPSLPSGVPFSDSPPLRNYPYHSRSCYRMFYKMSFADLTGFLVFYRIVLGGWPKKSCKMTMRVFENVSASPSCPRTSQTSRGASSPWRIFYLIKFLL